MFAPEPGSLAEVGGPSWGRVEVRRELARRLARLDAAGLQPGDRVLVLFGNRAAFFVELLAIWRLGGCAIPVDARSTAFEVETLARAAEARLAVVDDATAPERVAPLRAAGLEVFSTDDPLPDAEPVREHGLALEADALILFTSGSTGEPKGVVHTHRSLLAKWIALRNHLGLEAFRRTLCLLPTHFGHGLICNALFPWLAGQELVVAPPFRPELLMRLGELVDEHRITFLSSVPSMWRLALRVAAPPTRGTLERVHVGSAPLSAHLWEGIRSWAGTPRVANAYGITETGSWIAGTAGDCEPEDGLIGEPWGAEIAIRRHGPGSDDPGECEEGEPGFVWVRTPALMRGYFRREDLTREVVQGGWFATGDIGLLDARGRLHLFGRVREEINKGGAKIYPGDVDAVAERFPGVLEACTFAVDDPAYGQNVGIALVLESGGDAELRALHEWMKEHLAEHKLPVRWYTVEEIPRTSRGKVNRESVRDGCAGLQPVDLASLLRRAS